ncbi:MAG: hypothetical protein F6K17_27240 [Okeania sp. SIO3C4]|nr:hypothetical protein [Okeania sp. SIO3B3]NER06020.1 hypothetical protein [Okeania sp. SIO3C4]
MAQVSEPSLDNNFALKKTEDRRSNTKSCFESKVDREVRQKAEGRRQKG